jgi:hypothetical protein
VALHISEPRRTSVTLSSDTFSLLILALALVVVIGIFVRITSRLRRGGGSLTTIVLGATDEFLTRERSKAAETIVNENAGKKFKDQGSDEPKEPTERDSP